MQYSWTAEDATEAAAGTAGAGAATTGALGAGATDAGVAGAGGRETDAVPTDMPSTVRIKIEIRFREANRPKQTLDLEFEGRLLRGLNLVQRLTKMNTQLSTLNGVSVTDLTGGGAGTATGLAMSAGAGTGAGASCGGLATGLGAAGFGGESKALAGTVGVLGFAAVVALPSFALTLDTAGAGSGWAMMRAGSGALGLAWAG